MARLTRHVDVTPAQVFAVLSDGWMYSNWVTGTSHVRAVSDDWPAVGAKIHHASGVWPAVGRDETVVERMVPDELLELTARGRPLGEAHVLIRLSPEGSGTLIDLDETPSAGPGKWLHNPLTEGLLRRRNVETLERLAAVVERRTEPDD